MGVKVAATPKDRPAETDQLRRAWVVEVPDWHPPRFNAARGRHWSVGARATKEVAEFVGTHAALAGVPKVGPANPVVRRIAVTLYGWPTGRVPDPDAFLKHLLDGMKRAGLIVDDSQDWALWSRPVVVRAATRTTVIEIGDVA